jgi:hypothetical protein
MVPCFFGSLPDDDNDDFLEVDTSFPDEEDEGSWKQMEVQVLGWAGVEVPLESICGHGTFYCPQYICCRCNKPGSMHST